MKSKEVQVIKKIEKFVNELSSIGQEDTVLFSKTLQNNIRIIDELSLLVPPLRKDLMKLCFTLCSKEFDVSVLQYHSRYKPLGHPGDYLIIDWIYTEECPSPTERGKLWDSVYQLQTAAQAVRNRKDFLNRYFSGRCDTFKYKASFLDLACGSCREVVDVISKTSYDGKLVVHCVDMDLHAINYARSLTDSGRPNTNFILETDSVIRIKPVEKYDFIWCSGLIDYMTDRVAVIMFKRIWKWLNDGGQAIIGNFHPRNPTRNLMEWTQDWFLIYRTEDDLVNLCKQAGIPTGHVSFDQEPLGVNIFCVLTKD